MPVKNKKPVLPDWMKEAPCGEMLLKIKENSFEFISTKMLQGEEIEAASDLLHEFIALLCDKLDAFRDIKKGWVQSTHAFIGAIRLELRNQIDKVTKMIEKGKLVVRTNKDASEQHEDEENAESNEDQDEEVGEDEEEEEEFGFEKEPTAIQPEVTKDRKANVVPTIKKSSKQISKDKGITLFDKLSKKHPDSYKKVAHLHAIIEGREFELKDLKEKYEKATKSLMALDSPSTPPPCDVYSSDQD